MINRLNMFDQVSGVIQVHSADWAGIEVFGSIAARFEQSLTSFRELMAESETVQRGVRATKDSLQKEIFQKTLDLTRSLKVYAVQNFDVGLSEQLKPIGKDLRKSPKQEALVMIEFVLRKAEEHSSELSSYGVTSGIIAELSTLKNRYAILIHSTRKAIIERKSINETISRTNKEISSMLVNEMDPIIRNLKLSSPAFFSQYFAARVVLNPGYRSLSSQNQTPEVPVEPDDGE